MTPRPFCIVSYTFGGNGPWNYFYEKPPEGVKTVHHVGILWEITDTHYLVATEFMTMEDGSFLPIHLQHFNKDAVSSMVGTELVEKLFENIS